MNIESKSVSGDYAEYLNFGWQFTQDTSERIGRTSHMVHLLVRDKDMPNYDLLFAYETKYFNLKKDLKSYKPVEGFTAFLLALLLLFPMIIYLIYKNDQYRQIKEHNDYVRKCMQETIDEAKKLF